MIDAAFDIESKLLRKKFRTLFSVRQQTEISAGVVFVATNAYISAESICELFRYLTVIRQQIRRRRSFFRVARAERRALSEPKAEGNRTEGRFLSKSLDTVRQSLIEIRHMFQANHKEIFIPLLFILQNYLLW